MNIAGKVCMKAGYYIGGALILIIAGCLIDAFLFDCLVKWGVAR